MTRATPAVLRLTGAVDESGRARAFVARRLDGLPADLCDDALLLTSELVSNVVRHGEVPARLELTVSGGELRIVVHDSSSVLPPLAHENARVDTTAASGRGLIIVTAIARAWGVSTEPGVVGKGVWVELDYTVDRPAEPIAS